MLRAKERAVYDHVEALQMEPPRRVARLDHDTVSMAMPSAKKAENVLGSPRFEPLRVLGEGGSGIVYEVRARSGLDDGDKRIALKVLRAELAPSERERRRFLEEAERMQRVDAPGLVKLLEAGLLPDGRPYLAMPLLEGETLAARIRKGPVPPETALRWFEVLARALEALHAAGMVHRDVKPENILVVDDAPVLLDFGIARDIDDDATTTTAEGRVRGTPAYMAPERFFGAPASVRSDVYELGVVLYTMLVGRLPWGSEKNVAERLNPVSPRDVGADVSTSLATVILRALSTRPEMRPASALELAKEVADARTTTGESADEPRRTADMAIVRGEAPASVRVSERPSGALPYAETALADVAQVTTHGATTRADTPKARTSTAPSSGSGPAWSRRLGTAAIVLGIALAAAFAGRAIGRDSARASGSAAPTACAAILAPVEVPPSAPAPAPASVSAPASASASSSARAPSRPSVSPKPGSSPAAAPPSSPSPAVSNPARYFEDRR